ncbi:MAG: helix-turn-helix domain-containing protein [Solobacterium sp.]|nr:helix-turn-helix domain-containing protein [Solobacterium sp.]
MAVMDATIAQQIVETVKETCGYDINYITDRGIILASTDSGRIGDYHEIGFQAGRKGTAIEVEEDNMYEGTHAGVNIPFYFHHQLVGVIGITGKPDEVRRYGQLAVRIMRLMLKERDLEQSLEARRAEASYILHSLISGCTVNRDMLTGFLDSKKLPAEGRYRIVRIYPKKGIKNTQLNTLENRIEVKLSDARDACYAYDYPGEFIVLQKAETFAESEAYWKELTELASVSAGSPRTLSHISSSYEEAGIAHRSGTGDYAVFDALPLAFIFSSVPARMREAYVQRTVSGLSNRQKEILTEYYKADMSLKNAADALFIHKNTLQYQLDRVRDMTGLDPRNFQDAVSLYIALHLQKLEEASDR